MSLISFGAAGSQCRPTDGSCQASERTHLEPAPRRSSSHSSRPRPAKPSALPVALGRETLGMETAAAHAHGECGADALMPSASPAKGKKSVRKVKHRAASTAVVAAEGDKVGGSCETGSLLDEAVNQMSAGAAECQLEALLSQHLDQLRAAMAAEQRAEELISQHLSEIRARRQDGGFVEGEDAAAEQADLLHLVAELAALGKGSLGAPEASTGFDARALEGTEFAREEPALSITAGPAVRRPAGWRRMMGRLPLAAAFGWSASSGAQKRSAAAALAGPSPLQIEVARWAARVRRANAGGAPELVGGGGWGLEDWLRSGPAPAELARVLSRQLGAQGDPALQLAFARALPELSGPEAVRDLLHRSAALDALAAALCTAARELHGPGGQDGAGEQHGSWRRQIVDDLARGKNAEGLRELASSPSWAGLRIYFGPHWAAVHRELATALQQDIARAAAGPAEAGALRTDDDDAMMWSVREVLSARRRWSAPHRAVVEAAGAALRQAGGEQEAATQVATFLGSFEDITGLLDACAGDEKLISHALERLPSAAFPAVLRGKILEYRERAASRNGFLVCLADILATPEPLQSEAECLEELQLLAACAGPDISLPRFFRRALQAAEWTWAPPDFVTRPDKCVPVRVAAITVPAKTRHLRLRCRVEDAADRGDIIIYPVKQNGEKDLCHYHLVHCRAIDGSQVREVTYAIDFVAEQGDTLVLDCDSRCRKFKVSDISVSLAPADSFLKLLSKTARDIVAQGSRKAASLQLLHLLAFSGTESTSELAELDSFFSSFWVSLRRRGNISLCDADENRLQDVGHAVQQFKKTKHVGTMKLVRRTLNEVLCAPNCTQARFELERRQMLLIATVVARTPTTARLCSDEIWFAELILGGWEAQGKGEAHVRKLLGDPDLKYQEGYTTTWMQTLARVLTGLKQPVPVYLRDGNVGRPMQLAAAMKGHKGKPFLPQGGELGEDWILSLSLYLLAHPDLQTLDFKSLRIHSCEAASAAAQAMIGITTLSAVNALSCGIGATGARAIAERLRLTQLTQLFLGGNRIGDKGAEAIADALYDEQVLLTALDLSFCDIGRCGGRALAAALGKNDGLQSLWLHGNPLGTVEYEDSDSSVDEVAWYEGLLPEKPRFVATLVQALEGNPCSALRAMWVQKCELQQEELLQLEAFGVSRGCYFYRY